MKPQAAAGRHRPDAQALHGRHLDLGYEVGRQRERACPEADEQQNPGLDRGLAGLGEHRHDRLGRRRARGKAQPIHLDHLAPQRDGEHHADVGHRQRPQEERRHGDLVSQHRQRRDRSQEPRRRCHAAGGRSRGLRDVALQDREVLAQRREQGEAEDGGDQRAAFRPADLEAHVDVGARHDAADQAAGHDGPDTQLPLAGVGLVELLLASGVGLRLGRLRRRIVVFSGHERSWWVGGRLPALPAG